jgi:hypothetical protein
MRICIVSISQGSDGSHAFVLPTPRHIFDAMLAMLQASDEAEFIGASEVTTTTQPAIAA